MTSTTTDAAPALPPEPLQQIALCLSGGGFRATAFSLGVISYLQRVQFKGRPLLESVKFVTSTSGGSIANGYYSACVYNGVPLIEFYNNLRQAMNGEDLLSTVSGILTDPGEWTEKGIYTDKEGNKHTVYKERNLINSFAKAYDQVLFKGKTLGDIASKKPNHVPFPFLEETAFNTTEFNNGLAFYFQVNGHKHWVAYNGNGYLQFQNPGPAQRLKLSDIVAASSCFPGAFEPIRFPVDFVHENNEDLDAQFDAMSYDHNNPDKRENIIRKPFALMDGGIVDNMGLNCLLKADRSRQKNNGAGFDLILSCDVTSYFNDPPKETTAPARSWFGHWTIRGIIRAFLFAHLVLAAAVISIIKHVFPVAGYLLLLPSLSMVLFFWIGFCKIIKAKKKETGTVAIALKNLSYFFRLPLRHLAPMLDRRIKTVSKLVGDLFLKQIRREQYNFFFNIPGIKDRAIACLVYEFSKPFETKRLENLNTRDLAWWPDMQAQLMPSIALQQMVNEAKSMDTTLWFTPEDQHKRDQLIATGQLTACYSLIKHICRLQSTNPEHKDNKDLMALKQKLLSDWNLFQAKPQCLVNKPF